MITIELDYETADEISIANLKESYKGLRKEIKEIKKTPKVDRAEYQAEDLRNFKRTAKAIKRTLRHFMTHDEYQKFNK